MRIKFWVIMSSLVFSSPQVQGFSVHFADYFTMEISQLIWFSYVDNCGMVQSNDYVEATHLQIILTISEWGDLISITRGCLAPDKRKWYLVDYK